MGLHVFAAYYSTMVLYIGIMKIIEVSCPKIPPTNQPNIYFVTAWKHWLGIQSSPKMSSDQLKTFASSCNEVFI